MNKITNLRNSVAKNEAKVSSYKGGVFYFLNQNRNLFLGLILLGGIAFTGGKIMYAAATPDPGHDVSEIGGLDTSAVPENGNLYYTDARARGSVSATAPLSYNNATGALSLSQSNTSTDGYLSSADWNIFNNKESAIVAGASSQYFRGDKTWANLDTSVVPENGNMYYTDARFDSRLASKTTADVAEGSNLYYTDARVDSRFDTDLAAKTTTDLVEGTNLYYTDARADARVLAVKGIAGGLAELDGGGKIPFSQIPDSIIGKVEYKGTWDAGSDTPNLTTATPNKGDYYIVFAGGSTDLSGTTDWNIGDWAIYDGANWSKVENTDSVASVNGYTGAITLNKSDIGLGSVEDTALSTWTGGANIATLGTITSGIWNGSIIDPVFGGTGLSSLGTANQILSMNAAGDAMEYKNITAGNGITVTHTAGDVTISANTQNVRTTVNNTTNSLAATDISGLNFPIGANEVWSFEFNVSSNRSGTPGAIKYAVSTPAAATLEADAFGFTSGAVMTSQRITTSGLLTASNFSTLSGDTWAKVTGVVSNGGTAGNVQLRFASTAAGSTAKVYANSYVTARRIQ